jgi:HEAT repeat protein
MTVSRIAPSRLLFLAALAAAVCLGATLVAADKDKESIEQLVAMLREKNQVKQLLALEKLRDREASDDARKEIVTALLECCEGKDGVVAKHAAEALPSWVTSASTDVPRLIKLVSSNDAFVRGGAITALGHLKEKRAIKAIGERLEAENRPAVRALAEIGGPEAEAVAFPHVNSKNTEVAVETCRLLKLIGTRESLPTLEGHLKDRNEGFVWIVKNTIRAIKDREANGGKNPVDAKFVHKPRSPFRFDHQSKDRLEKGLAAVFYNRSGRETYGTLDEWEEMEPVDAVRADVIEVLLRHMEGMDGSLAGACGDLLHHWVAPGYADVYRIIHLIDSHNGHVAAGALRALGRMQDQRGIEMVAERLPFDWNVAGKALRDLGPIAEKATWPALKARKEAVGEACRVLKVIGTKESIPALQPLLTEKNEFLIAAAKTAIRWIQVREANGGKMPVDPKWTRKPPAILKPIEKPKDDLEKDINCVFSKNAGTQSLALSRLGIRPPVEERRAEVVELLFRTIDAGSATVAPKAGLALPNWVTRDTVDVNRLLLLLDCGAGEVRAGVHQTLARLKDPETAAAAAEWFIVDSVHASKALIAIGPSAEKLVWPYLKARDRAHIAKAIEVLKEIGSAASIKELEAVTALPQQAKDAIQVIKDRGAKSGQ